MVGLNRVQLIGRLGRDPEVRYTPSGATVANFSIATSDEWKDKETGQKQENRRLLLLSTQASLSLSLSLLFSLVHTLSLSTMQLD